MGMLALRLLTALEVVIAEGVLLLLLLALQVTIVAFFGCLAQLLDIMIHEVDNHHDDNRNGNESENDISKGKFNAYGGKSTDVTYIASLERSFKTNSAKGFVKDLKNTPCKMFFILPDKNYSLEDYVKSLTYDKLVSMPESVSPTEFSNVSIPEFSVSKNVSLKNTLENLGVKRIFSKEADISKGFAEDVYVDDITQSVSVTVNHSGVSAGEDTPSDNSLKNKNDVQPKVKDTIIFDRPFIYAVVDNESYIPIIIGTVNNPK